MTTGQVQDLLFWWWSLFLLAPALASPAGLRDRTCLTGPTSYSLGQRKNVSLGGVSQPLKLGRLDWMESIIQEWIFRIIAEEVLGINTVLAETFEGTRLGWRALLECMDPATGALRSGYSGPHLAMGFWLKPDFVEEMESETQRRPNLVPLGLGSVGYTGSDGLYLRAASYQAAMQQHHLPLDLYMSYSHPIVNPAQYFDPPASIDVERLRPCNESLFTDVRLYTAASNDTDGVLVTQGQEGAVYAARCTGRWWPAPACRSNASRCLPVITGGDGWSLLQLMQWAEAWQVPAAIAVAKDSANYRELPWRHRLLFYWWAPDNSFVGLGERRILWPRHDPLDIARTDTPEIGVEKFACKGLGKGGSGFARPLALLQKMSFSLPEMRELGERVARRRGDPEAVYEAVACGWLNRHWSRYSRWIPRRTSCRVQQGLVDKSGAFVAKRRAADHCDWCIPGRASRRVWDKVGMTYVCEACAGGTFQKSMGTTSCEPCEAGRHSLPQATSCSLCPRGSFSAAAGASACQQCPPLQTTVEIGAATGVLCVCSQGSYGAGAGVHGACQACPARAHSRVAAANASECRCERGTYMSASGACTSCPPGSTTEEDGKTSASSCLCSEGEYMPAGDDACAPCPSTMHCAKGSNEANFVHLGLARRTEEQQFPMLLPRYWSSADNPMSVFDCRDKNKCPGGAPGSACAAHMQNSVACQHCIAAHQWDGNACVECTASEWLGYAVPLVLLAGAPFLIAVLYWLSGESVDLWGLRSYAISGLAFVALNHYQMLDVAAMGAFIPVEYRRGSDSIAWVNDLYQIVQPECMGVNDLSVKIALKAASPVVAWLVCLVTYFMSVAAARFVNRPWLQMDRNRLFSVFGSVCFTFFGPITLMSMSLFKCSRNPNGRFTLAWDLSVICFSSGEWRSMLGIAIYCVAVYVFGLGSLLIRAIIIAPKHFRNPDFQLRWEFLFRRFHSGAYWWGLVHLAKNSLIQMVFVIFSPGWRGLSAALAGLTIYTGAATFFVPYRWTIVNAVEVASGVCVLLVTSLLLLFADRQAGSGDDEIMAALLAIGSLPLCLALVGMVFAARYGRRMQPTAAQEQRAAEGFLHLVESARAMAAMDPEVGIQFLLWLGDWECRFCLRSATILRCNLLGTHASGVLSYSVAPERVRASAMASAKSFRVSNALWDAEADARDGASVLEESEADADSNAPVPKESKASAGAYASAFLEGDSVTVLSF